ncbi:MAG: DUF86 domain-containing protein [Bacillota bacterium]
METRKKHSHIPWRDIAGMRDVLIHKYSGIDYDEIWDTINNDLADLKESINKIIKYLEG